MAPQDIDWNEVKWRTVRPDVDALVAQESLS
jgi:hypothetical protein